MSGVRRVGLTTVATRSAPPPLAPTRVGSILKRPGASDEPQCSVPSPLLHTLPPDCTVASSVETTAQLPPSVYGGPRRKHMSQVAPDLDVTAKVLKRDPPQEALVSSRPASLHAFRGAPSHASVRLGPQATTHTPHHLV
jgi:hypothetical protein